MRELLVEAACPPQVSGPRYHILELHCSPRGLCLARHRYGVLACAYSHRHLKAGWIPYGLPDAHEAGW